MTVLEWSFFYLFEVDGIRRVQKKGELLHVFLTPAPKESKRSEHRGKRNPTPGANGYRPLWTVFFMLGYKAISKQSRIPTPLFTSLALLL